MNTITSPAVPNVFIATPMYGGQCFGAYEQGVLRLQDMFKQIGWSFSMSMIFNESLITRARNALVQQFLKSPCTHLFFIDADIRFEPGEAKMMVDADKDVICGIYPKKEINWTAVRNAIKAGVPDDQLKFHTGSFVVNLVNYQGAVTVPVNAPVEIWEGGTGFMMIKREVFEKMKPHCPVYKNDVAGSGTIREEITEYFATSIDPKTERLLSEDYHFCHTWRNKCGGKVHAAPWVNLAHFGTYAFEGQLLRHVATPEEAKAFQEAPKAPRSRKRKTSKAKTLQSAKQRNQKRSRGRELL